MRSWQRLMVMVICFGLIVIPCAAHAESEPNDTMAQADPLSIGYALADTTASLASSSDIDYYKITVTANQTYVIETFNIDGTPYDYATGLWLYNSSGTLITDDSYGNDGSGNANARIVYKFVNAGTYYIKVAKSGYTSAWSGSYSIRVLPKYDQTGAGWDAANDYEPNDVFELATLLHKGYNKAVTRTLFDHSNFVTHDPDIDMYRFASAAGETYVIETFNIDGTPYDYATGLWLYNSSGTLITDDSYGNDGSGNVNARIVYTFPNAGTYYIKVAKSGYTSAWSGSYSLRLLPKYNQAAAGWDAANDYEPNDEFAISNAITLGPNGVTRQLFNHNNFVTHGPDVDIYRFTAQAGKTYVMETYNITTVPNTNATGLWLYNPSGTFITDDEYGHNGTGYGDARIEFTFSTSGTYFVAVRHDAYQAWTGTYSFRVCESTCMYRAFVPSTRK